MPFLLTVSIMLASCVPSLYLAYYEPSYPDQSSKLTKLYCGGHAGPPAKLTFLVPDGMRFMVVYREDIDKNRPLNIDIAIPPGVNFQFLSDAIRIAETKDAAGSMISSPEISIVTSVRLPFDAWVDFSLLGPTSFELAQSYLLSNPKDKFATASFTFGESKDFSPRKLEMTLPPIQTLHEAVAIPPIELFRVVGRDGVTYIVHDPHKIEKLLRYFPFDNFSIRLDDFSIRGVVNAEPSNHLFSNLREPNLHYLARMETQRVDKWKFSGAAVRFKNSDSSEIWRVLVETMDVVWSIRVPFVSPVRATASGQNPQTSLSIRTELGKNESDTYFIELPPFLLNGVKHQLSPIKLERKSFGVGIDPFNC